MEGLKNGACDPTTIETQNGNASLTAGAAFEGSF